MNSDCRFEQISARPARWCKVCFGSHLGLTHHVVDCWVESNLGQRAVSAIIVIVPTSDDVRRARIRADLDETRPLVVSIAVPRFLYGLA